MSPRKHEATSDAEVDEQPIAAEAELVTDIPQAQVIASDAAELALEIRAVIYGGGSPIDHLNAIRSLCEKHWPATIARRPLPNT